MQDNTLLKIALSLSVIGIITLFFTSKSLAAEESALTKLTGEAGDEIKFTGKISRITEKGNFTIMEITKQETITAVVFDKTNLKQGNDVEVKGKLEDYKNQKEILVDEIYLLENRNLFK